MISIANDERRVASHAQRLLDQCPKWARSGLSIDTGLTIALKFYESDSGAAVRAMVGDWEYDRLDASALRQLLPSPRLIQSYAVKTHLLACLLHAAAKDDEFCRNWERSPALGFRVVGDALDPEMHETSGRPTLMGTCLLWMVTRLRPDAVNALLRKLGPCAVRHCPSQGQLETRLVVTAAGEGRYAFTAQLAEGTDPPIVWVCPVTALSIDDRDLATGRAS